MLNAGALGTVRDISKYRTVFPLSPERKSVDNILVTYKKPKVKSKATPTFLFTLVFRSQETLTGINKRSMSVRVLNAPLALSRFGMLTHVPGLLLSHILALGVHSKILARVMAT